MNHESEHPSVDIHLLIDSICDEVEREFRQGKWPGLDSLLPRVPQRGWKIFVAELIETIRQTAPDITPAKLKAYLSTGDEQISTLVEQAINAPDPSQAPNLSNQDTRQVDSMEFELRDEAFEIPDSIDQFHIIRQIGMGGFGHVLLARDAILKREVVLKLPRPEKFKSEESLQEFLKDAQRAAALEHPGIVPVLHVGIWQSRPYIVQPYMAGGDLNSALHDRTFSFLESADLIAQICDAIAVAHRNRIVHRDLKPANILLEKDGRPRVADFGLAIHESEQVHSVGEVAGTYRYMSPEQLRGETHRIDGRSDVWSIGVLLYRMLAGSTPFQGNKYEEIRDQVLQREPRPLRQLNSAIPEELERICLKCLSLRMNDRYTTATDLAHDLRQWIHQSHSVDAPRTEPLQAMTTNGLASVVPSVPSVSTAAAKTLGKTEERVVPKGLMAFDARDGRFFLRLLPGPYDRDGLPERVRIWKERLESSDPEETFSVGLIFGPSGCGKSSLIRAGLIPHLASYVRPVYVESTINDTEVRMMVGLRKHFPEIPRDLTIPQVISEMRNGKWLLPGEKVVLFFDQFEQWLHSHDVRATNQLVEALRHCDGRHVQAVILARDDFWMAVSRFFQELEVPLSEHHNFGVVDLFDQKHARRVLQMFGEAFGQLPLDGKLSDEQEKFLDEAIRQLSENDLVICIRLVLFAETIKHQPWSIETLKRFGNAEEIGTLFLEQTLDSRAVNPQYRLYARPIRRILGSLLPEAGTEIKAHFQSVRQLHSAVADLVNVSDLLKIIDILDRLRLITPTEPDLGEVYGPDEGALKVADEIPNRYYQLTHDFLVPSIRAWLDRKQLETSRGRALSRLSTLGSSFRATGDRRFMPSFFEYLTLLRHRVWNAKNQHENQLLKLAHRRYMTWGLGIIALVLVLSGIGGFLARKNHEAVMTANCEQFLNCDPAAVPIASQLLELDPSFSIKYLANVRHEREGTDDDLYRVDCGLLYLEDSDGPTTRKLVQDGLSRSVDEFRNLVMILQRHVPQSVDVVRELLTESGLSLKERSRLKIALLHLGETGPFVDTISEERGGPAVLSLIYEVSTVPLSTDNYISLLKSMNRESLGLRRLMRGLIDRPFLSEADRRAIAGRLGQMSDHDESGQVLSLLHAYTVRHERNNNVEPQSPIERLKFVTIQPRMDVDVKAAHGVRDASQFLETFRALRPFSISTTEVSEALYAEFYLEMKDKLKLSSFDIQNPGDTPVTNVRLYDALEFCNWLSKRTGKTPVYVRTDEPITFRYQWEEDLQVAPIIELLKPYNSYTIDVDADGYRLPSEAELFLCGTDLTASKNNNDDFTDDLSSILERYAWFQNNTYEHSRYTKRATGRLLPNDFGLFDIVGNASEFTVDGKRSPVSIACWPLDSSYSDDYVEIIKHQFMSVPIYHARSDLGFRVAISNLPAK